LVEWPLPSYPLRERLLAGLVEVYDGAVRLTRAPGLGVELTTELEREFPFRPDAVYRCCVNPTVLPEHSWIR
jgi:hypothetical protein